MAFAPSPRGHKPISGDFAARTERLRGSAGFPGVFDLGKDDPETLRQTAELCMIVAAKTPHMPDYREHLLALAAECMARSNEDDPGGIQARSLILEMPDSRAQ